MSSEPAAAPASLAQRLSKVRVGLRADLDVTRHVFRGQPTYIIRDPMTFQSHRFDPGDYEVLVAIDATRTLGDIFADLVSAQSLEQSDEERFYQFVFQLHRLGLLNLPISDEKVLYRRFRARADARRKKAWISLLFLRIPLWNPDEFLNRTIRFARPVFSVWFFALWLLVVGAAAAVAIARGHEIAQPLDGLLAAKNLPVMWFTLIGLKVFHEFGHAYACKQLGGHVPEMGAYMIAFTPCAYVDATASWGFTRTRDRIIVGLAGMYIEVFIAALAVFVWTLTGPSLLHSVAYNIMFLASATTILFNVNPLMRYDGYYIFSDITEIPNLRARANRYVIDCLKRYVLGVRLSKAPMTRSLKLTLAGYGVASSAYRTLVLLGIAAMIASKILIVGLFMAGFYIASTVFGLLRKLTVYLWYADETAPVRMRAMAASGLVFAAIPTILFLIPVRWHIQASGLVHAERETVVHALSAGFLTTPHVAVGQQLAPGDAVAELESSRLGDALLDVESRLAAAEIRRDAYRADELARAQREQRKLPAIQHERAQRISDLDALTVRAPVAGRVVESLRATDIGRYVELGDPVATLVAGGWTVRVVLTEEQMLASAPQVDEQVTFRPRNAPQTVIGGAVQRIRPLGSKTIESTALTQAGGGDIVVGPSQQAVEPYFEVTVLLDSEASEGLQRGATGVVRFGAQPEPIGLLAYRSVVRFLDNLAKG